MTNTTPAGRGGEREGTRRKAMPAAAKIRVVLWLSPDVVERLKSLKGAKRDDLAKWMPLTIVVGTRLTRS